jgi:anti-sigma factor RsiW
MNECEHAGKLTAYHDGWCDEQTRASLERHLAQCDSCSSELARLRKLSEILGGTERPGLSAQALKRIHAAVEAAPTISIRRLAEALTAVAAAILVVCGAYLLLPSVSASEAAAPVWEATAVQHPTEQASTTDDQLAMWMVQDLSGETSHGQN